MPSRPFFVSNDIPKICKQRIDNALNAMIGHLNINSIRKKIVLVDTIIKVFEIFLISESKLDNTILFNTFTTEALSETGPFMHLSKQVFQSQ